jgi:hypothetical protein
VSAAAIASFRDAAAEPITKSARLAGYIAHKLRTPLATQCALLELRTAVQPKRS